MSVGSNYLYATYDGDSNYNIASGSSSVTVTTSGTTTPGTALALTPGIITTVVGNGTQGYLGDSGSPLNAEVNLPNDVAIDAFGNLYLTDTANERIRVVNRGANAIHYCPK